jgi:histidine decarboxylase
MELFAIRGRDESRRRMALAQARKFFEAKKGDFLGFQANQDLHYAEELGEFMDLQINNLGDPYAPQASFRIQSRFAERAVLDYYSRLWNAQPYRKDDGETTWGYVLSMGATEGNLLALWEARDYLRGEPLRLLPASPAAQRRRAPTGNPAIPWDHVVAFFSADSHYSIRRALDIVDVPTFGEVGDVRYPGMCPLSGWERTWPEAVPSVGKDHRYGTGEIDIDALAPVVEFFAKRGHRILIVLNVGTTFKCAYDDVKGVATRLAPIFEKHGLQSVDPTHPRRGYWVHVDGALGATYLPFLEKARNQGLTTQSAPVFDFRVEAVHSIVASGHKWPGAPWPCGIYMTLQKYQIEPPTPVSYIGAPDTTLAGSRNGLSALLLWSRLSKKSEDEEIAMVMKALELTDYLFEQLCNLDGRKGGLLSPAKSSNALTVRFVCPIGDNIVKRYSLSFADVPSESGAKVTYAHAYVMPHVTKALIDRFIRDLQKETWTLAGKRKSQPRRRIKGTLR